MSWWILIYPRPLGASPFIYEGSPPNQNAQLVWINEEERYIDDPWDHGHPKKFSTEFEARKYMKEFYPHNIKDLQIIRLVNLCLL